MARDTRLSCVHDVHTAYSAHLHMLHTLRPLHPHTSRLSGRSEFHTLEANESRCLA
jgi:hypothetical protein